MKISCVVVLLTISQLIGCGSLRTVVASNQDIAYSLKKHDSYCKASTRIYSGVTYDFCRFNAKPKAGTINGVKSVAFIFDIGFFAPIMDTVLLPVTIPQQIIYGNPQIK